MTRRPVDIQRLRDVPRELLRSRDLRDRAAAGDQRRWWHNRALHDSFGVAAGMDVALTTDATSVLVQPGVAYDRVGRELLLFAPRAVPVPAQLPMTLIARYRQHAAGQRTAEAGLVWQPSAPASGEPCGPAGGVPLATLDDDKGKLTVRAENRRSRPLARPRIGYGSTPGDATPWQVWDYLSDQDRIPLGLQIVVDTSTAGFTGVPCYFAWLQWPQVADSRLPYLLYVTLAFQYVQDEAIDRFLFRVLLPLPALARREHLGFAQHGAGDSRLGVGRSLGLSLCWLGVQHEDSAANGREL